MIAIRQIMGGVYFRKRFWSIHFDCESRAVRTPACLPSIERAHPCRYQKPSQRTPRFRYISSHMTPTGPAQHDPARQLLRHTVAALAYRAARALDGAPDHFAGFALAGRLPVQILAHMGDLFDWALSISLGQEQWQTAQARPWAEEKARFFSALKAFDDFLASDVPLKAPIDRLMQGPVSDALTHVGQLAMLRRLAGNPTTGENFFIADVAVGCVGADQPAAVQPFK
jgi:hypothetical protein